MKLTVRLGLLLGLCLASAVEAHAQARDLADGQIWVQVLAIGALSANWRSHVEAQPRVMDNGSELGLSIVRTAIGRQVTPRLSLWLGHAWVPRTLGEGVQHEQRIFQQLLVTTPLPGEWATTTRLRVEQRWLDPWADASHRVRLLVRAQKPIGTSRASSVIVYDEAMYTLDATVLGPGKGFDRNRLAALFGRRLSQSISIETGYIWEHSRLQGDLRRNDHVISGVVNLIVPRRSS
jgi:hypothetical protein